MQRVSFIGQNQTNKAYSLIHILYTVECMKGVNNQIQQPLIYKWYWHKEGETRTRLIGEFEPHYINSLILAETLKLTETKFVGWVTPNVPEPNLNHF